MLISKDGWVHTGDIGSLHDGYLKVFGRKSNAIIRAGANPIYPVVVEKTMRQFEGVSEVKVHIVAVS